MTTVISILTLNESLYEPYIDSTIIKRAQDKGFVLFNIVCLLDLVEPKVRVDGKTVGHGPGMVIKPEVVEAGINLCESKFGPAYKIFFSPQGTLLSQTLLRDFASIISDKETVIHSEKSSELKSKHILLVCPRFEGVDHRTEIFYADLLLSIGNFVLLGGDLPAQVFLEGVLRLIPGVLGNEESIIHESFETPIFDYPEYCKPNIWQNLEIPTVLQSGNHKKIQTWRNEIALKNTITNRYDVFRAHPQARNLTSQAIESLPPHYAVLMHDKIKNKDGIIGTTSIKSLDLHDISRSAVTYGIKKMFVVQPLVDQQAIAKEFFSFWTDGHGKTYNETRTEAVEKIEIVSSLEEVLEKIKMLHNQEALIIATSAQKSSSSKMISYKDQKKIWQQNKPVLIMFGTGYGLAKELIDLSDYIFVPVEGLSQYNHLSVRAAAAIIFDRWLGLNPENPN